MPPRPATASELPDELIRDLKSAGPHFPASRRNISVGTVRYSANSVHLAFRIATQVMTYDLK